MGTEARNPNDRRAGRGAADAPRVAYVPRADATPEGELAALAAAYAFVLDRHEREPTAAVDDADEAKTNSVAPHRRGVSEE
ncbi:MAG: hypothetical protein M3522_04175 [Actinomycetota bacterium]|nr:hypothetical protein [Actinomycetota bacterium]